MTTPTEPPSRSVQARLDVRGNGLTDIERVKREIDAFITLIPEDHECSIQVSLSVRPHKEGQPSLTTRPEKVEMLKDILHEYQKKSGFRNVTPFIGHLGVSRATFYNWLNGKYLSRQSWEILLAKAPTEELATQLSRLYGMQT